nr:putative integron gene cassette protein [uncultured bacterium]
MPLVDDTIEVLRSIPAGEHSMLEAVYRSRDPEYGSWPLEAIQTIEKALLAASRRTPEHELLDEYNVLAASCDCDRLGYWNPDSPELELEMFLDEVLDAIEQEMAG